MWDMIQTEIKRMVEHHLLVGGLMAPAMVNQLTNDILAFLKPYSGDIMSDWKDVRILGLNINQIRIMDREFKKLNKKFCPHCGELQ